MREGTDVGGEGPYNAGLAVFSYIVGGILVWTLVGWGLDNLFGTRWIVLAGAFGGMAGGFYLAYVHGLTRGTLRRRNGQNADGGLPDAAAMSKNLTHRSAPPVPDHELPNDGHCREETR